MKRSSLLQWIHPGRGAYHSTSLAGLTALVIVAYLLISVSQVLAAEKEKDFAYVSVYLLRSLPSNRNVILGGLEQSNTSVTGAFGAGIKAAVFPAFTNRIAGIELESSGHRAEIAFPILISGGSHRASTDLTVLSTMLNFLIRYPGEELRPYLGIGGGLSSGILTGTDIPGRRDRGFESAPTLAHQFMAGLQVKLTSRSYVFGEYKYFVADYHWTKLSLEFRSQYVLAGMGLQF